MPADPARVQRITSVSALRQPEGADPVDLVQVRYEILRSRVLSADELDKLRPPEPLIEGYLVCDSVATTYGRPGTAKTLIALSQAFSIVTGTAWFGHAVKQGPVLYIPAEGIAGLAQRQRAWREVCGYPALDDMHWLPMTVNLLDSSWVAALAQLTAELRPVEVVVDTLARSMPGGDENNSSDMNKLVAAADEIRRASGACVNLVHHTPKDGSTPRGHSALEGAVDTELLLERAGSMFSLSVAKQKDLPVPEQFNFELMPVGTSVVPMLPRGVGSIASLAGADKAVYDLVWQCAGSDGLSPSALLKMSGVPERSFYRSLKALVLAGRVRNIGTGTRPRYTAVDLSEVNAANTANHCHGSAQTLTATGPPLRGLAVMGDSNSGGQAALDLNEGAND